MTNLQSEIGQIKLKNTALENSNKKEKESNEKLSKKLGVANKLEGGGWCLALW